MSFPPKKQPIPIPYDMGMDMRKNINTPLKYDNNVLPTDIIKKVSTSMGVNPGLLLSSAWQEGMNKAVADPEKVSSGYNDANVPLEYPVDGYSNYGLDTFGNKYNQLKHYLPEGFDKNIFLYDSYNDHRKKVGGKWVDAPQAIKTVAFKNNEDALTAKAAFMRMEMDRVSDYADLKGITLDDKAKNYFMLASYNSGHDDALKMMDEYTKAKDKNKFIDNGETAFKAVHKNIKPRLDNLKVADELLNPVTE